MPAPAGQADGRQHQCKPAEAAREGGDEALLDEVAVDQVRNVLMLATGRFPSSTPTCSRTAANAPAGWDAVRTCMTLPDRRLFVT